MGECQRFEPQTTAFCLRQGMLWYNLYDIGDSKKDVVITVSTKWSDRSKQQVVRNTTLTGADTMNVVETPFGNIVSRYRGARSIVALL